MATPPAFLTAVLGQRPRTTTVGRPHVTLTFAQSLDAKIAGAGGRQLILSGKESMVMTHWMRTMHDAIMVGIGTALNDDPQLNTRYLPPLPDDQPHLLPQPVILDAHLRLPLACKLLKNFQAHSGKQPWVVCAIPDVTDDPDVVMSWYARKQALEDAGARVVVPIATVDSKGYLTLSTVLSALSGLGVRSLMVEGGAQVIGSFLAESALVDTLIITVAPTLVGQDGNGYGAALGGAQMTGLKHIRSEIMGRDTVMAMEFIPQ